MGYMDDFKSPKPEFIKDFNTSVETNDQSDLKTNTEIDKDEIDDKVEIDGKVEIRTVNDLPRSYECKSSDDQVEVIQQEDQGDKKKKKGFLGIWGAIVLLLSKLKSLIILLKLGKFASTFVSMFLMIWVYVKLYGVAYGVGFVALLFVHELGHYISARMVKLNVTLPFFIPFVGAFINMKEIPQNAEIEAKVGLGGPILGSVGALFCVVLYFLTRHDFFLALAYTGFMINLFNLIPIRPLDGGRAVTAISPWLWLIGLPVAVIFVFKYFNPILIVLLVLGALEMIKQFKDPNKEYFNVDPIKRVVFAVIYFGLLASLGLGMAYIHSMHAYLALSQ